MKVENYFYEGDKMNIFVSWSGELSKRVAEELKVWIPCIIQSAEVFFSPEDIEKGQNWNQKIFEQLSECNYGVICLTKENRNAPWINFEAGAIAKALDSRIMVLMIDINPSDIQGPLSSFQATKLNKEEIFKLLSSINNCQENPIEQIRLTTLFNVVWGEIDNTLKEITASISDSSHVDYTKADNSELLEDILQAVREQSRILSNPCNLFPENYLSEVLMRSSTGNKDDLGEYTLALLYRIERFIDFFETLDGNFDNEYIIGQFREIVSMTNRMIRVQGVDNTGHGEHILLLSEKIRRRLNKMTHYSEKSVCLKNSN